MAIFVKMYNMETVDMRKALHQYIDEGDDRLVKMVYELVKEYHHEDYRITEDEINEFEESREKQLEYKRRRLIMEEREQHLKGEGKTYTWEEVKQSILSGKRL